MTAVFSWNLITDLQEMWSLPFMLNAFRAGTIVAVLAAVVGWFMVLRRQSFAGHTLAVIGFPGAAAAAWLGVSVATGYYVFCIAAAVAIAILPARGGRGYSEESAVIGTVQAFALAVGMLFVALYGGFLGSTTALLFGSFLGITSAQVLVLALAAAIALLVLAAIGRPLLFASVDTDVASASGLPTRRLAVVFLLLLGVTAAAASQTVSYPVPTLPPSFTILTTATLAYAMAAALVRLHTAPRTRAAAGLG
jgi:zinc/manganese transport system permease protein